MTTKRVADEFEGGLVPSVPSDEGTPGEVDSIPGGAEKLAEALGVKDGVDLDAVKALIDSAMRSRDAEIQALRNELATVQAGGNGDGFGETPSIGGYPWMYWRKPDTWKEEIERGWITYGPGGPTPRGNRDTGSYQTALRQGLQPVTRYGYLEPPKTPNAIDAYLPILKAGGAKEFPASQVVAYNWHITPPLRGIVFPQYEAVKDSIIEWVCEACGHSMSFVPEQRSIAGDNLRMHLMKAHKYPFREAAEAVKSAGLSLVNYRAQREPSRAELATAPS